jgi:hypothetical protein
VAPPSLTPALATVRLVPVGGSKDKLPRVPAGGAALATPPMSNDPAAATATARVPGTSRVKNFLLCTIQLFL